MPFVWWAVIILLLTLPSCCALVQALLLDAQLFLLPQRVCCWEHTLHIDIIL